MAPPLLYAPALALPLGGGGLPLQTDTTLDDDPPLVDELVWGDLLECHLDGGAHWHLVGRGAREIGIEIDPRVPVQGHHCQVVGLIGHAPVEAAILDHDVGRDM